MIGKLKNTFICLMAIGAVVCLSSCGKDSEPGVDEWESNYVYLQRPVLGWDYIDFNISHSSIGIEGDTDISLPVSICLSKPYGSAVSVKLDYTVEGDIPEGVLSFRKGGALTIPAGEQVIRDTLMFNTDWNFLLQAATEYTVKVNISSAEPVSGDLRISTKQDEIGLRIKKAQLIDIVANVKPEGERIDRSGWKAYYTKEKGVDVAWTQGDKLIDGNDASFEINYVGYMGIKIDMGSEQTLSGIEHVTFLKEYAIASCVIYSSIDGEEWTLVTHENGLPLSPSVMQYVKFIAPVKARYIMWGGTVNFPMSICAEIYTYSKNYVI